MRYFVFFANCVAVGLAARAARLGNESLAIYILAGCVWILGYLQWIDHDGDNR